MLAFVSVPTTSLREGLTTDPTFVRLFARVREFVLLQAGHLCKTLQTAVVLASVRPLPSVSSDVVLQVSSSGERLPTVGVRADKRSLSRVNPSVDVEVLRGVEALATSGKLALARPVGDVDLLDVRTQVCWKREGSLTPRMIALVRLVLLLLQLHAHAAAPRRHVCLLLSLHVQLRLTHVHRHEGGNTVSVRLGHVDGALGQTTAMIPFYLYPIHIYSPWNQSSRVSSNAIDFYSRSPGISARTDCPVHCTQDSLLTVASRRRGRSDRSTASCSGRRGRACRCMVRLVRLVEVGIRGGVSDGKVVRWCPVGLGTHTLPLLLLLSLLLHLSGGYARQSVQVAVRGGYVCHGRRRGYGRGVEWSEIGMGCGSDSVRCDGTTGIGLRNSTGGGDGIGSESSSGGNRTEAWKSSDYWGPSDKW